MNATTHQVATPTHASLRQHKKVFYLPWLVCFAATLFFFFEFMQVNMFNALSPALMKEFSLSAVRVGHTCATYFYANLIFLFPAGILLDRISTRKVILWAMAASIISAYSFAFAKHIWVCDLSRFITGIGGSFCFISCIRLATNWFPTRRLAYIIGLMVTMAMFGGVLAQTPMTLLTDWLGWRKMLLIDASIGLIMWGVIWWIVSDRPEYSSEQPQVPLSLKDFAKALRQSILNLQNWLGGCYTSLLNLPILLLGAIWGSLYLVQVHGLTRTEASLTTTMIFIGTMIGSPIIGWFSDRIQRRRLPMQLCAIASLTVLLTVIFSDNLSFICLLLLFFAIGFFTSGQIISYPLIVESNPRALIGTSESIAETLIMAGGMVQPLFAALMTLTWQHQLHNGLPLYSKTDFLWGLLIMPIACCLAFLGTLFVRETFCKPMHNKASNQPMKSYNYHTLLN